VKLCVPDDELLEELECGVGLACGVLVWCVEGLRDGAAVAECRWVGEADGDGLGVSVSPDVGEAPFVPARAPADPPVAAADGSTGGVDPLVPHAAKPTPPMTTAMITAGIRRVPMLASLR